MEVDIGGTYTFIYYSKSDMVLKEVTGKLEKVVKKDGDAYALVITETGKTVSLYGPDVLEARAQ